MAVGGGGITVARHVVRLGGRAIAVHTARGEVGLRLNRLLDEEGIDHVAVEIDDDTREALVLFEAESRRSYRIVPPGPRLHEREGQRCLQMLERFVGTCPYVVASGSLPDDYYAAVARHVKEAGSRLVLDTSGPALRAALAEGVFLFRCNRTEAESLTGKAIRGFNDARALNEDLLTTGAAEIAVTTLGRAGRTVLNPPRSHRVLRAAAARRALERCRGGRQHDRCSHHMAGRRSRSRQRLCSGGGDSRRSDAHPPHRSQVRTTDD
nr:PfkB family carbohydrate kinase [Streptomyces sp. DSM 40907]